MYVGRVAAATDSELWRARFQCNLKLSQSTAPLCASTPTPPLQHRAHLGPRLRRIWSPAVARELVLHSCAHQLTAACVLAAAGASGRVGKLRKAASGIASNHLHRPANHCSPKGFIQSRDCCMLLCLRFDDGSLGLPLFPCRLLAAYPLLRWAPAPLPPFTAPPPTG